MLQGSESTVFLTAGGVRALQKLGRYTDTERGSYLVVKLPLEAMDRAADLETGFRRGLYDTCSQACSSLLAWNTRMGFSSPLRRVFFVLRYVVACMDPLGGPNRA